MTAAVLDEDLVLDQVVASGDADRRRELRDRGHQLRAARRRSMLAGPKPAFARSACREHGRRAPAAASPQVRSGVYDDSAGTDGGLSCLANGTTKPIRDVHEGDSVLATDPSTGKTSARTVTATMSHDDNDLLDLTVRDGDGHEGVLKTTDHHKIWSVIANAWVLAADLHAGDQLREPDGAAASVVTLTHRPGHQDMLDLTVDTDHTFYVVAGDTSVLVHNCGGLEDLGLGLKADANTGSLILDGPMPGREAVRALSPADRVELQELLEKSIGNRAADQTSGVFSQVDPGHTARIAQEQSLLDFLKGLR